MRAKRQHYLYCYARYNRGGTWDVFNSYGSSPASDLLKQRDYHEKNYQAVITLLSATPISASERRKLEERT